MSKTTVNELKRLIGELSAKRQEYVEAIVEIDHTFASLGISDTEAVSTGKKRGRKPGSKNKTTAVSAADVPAAGKKRGRKPGSKNKKTAGAKRGPKPGSKRGRRGSFAVSGEQSVLDFVKSAGKPNAKEVNAHWSDEGRAGKADNALSKLVKIGSLKRVKTDGERGSRYAAV